MIPTENSQTREGVDVPLGPPPEVYRYRCSRCLHEMHVNEAVIDVEVTMAEFNGTYSEGFMPVPGCPNCNHETMEYAQHSKSGDTILIS